MFIFFTRSSVRRVIGASIVVGALYGAYSWWQRSQEPATITSAISLHEVTSGSVTNGISTTGTVRAAEVLDLNVYKLDARIDAVAVSNGTHVHAGDLILAFDESDTAVAIAQSDLDIRTARLSRDTTAAQAKDPNTTIATLQNDIATLERNLTEYEDDKRNALRDYLNASLAAEPTPARYEEQVDRIAPSIGGLYTCTMQGEYRIRVYASKADSGFSYALSGMEQGVRDIYPGAAIPLGTCGLKVTFPTSVTNNDEWIVAVPNTYAPTYPTNKQEYENTTDRIKESITTDTVKLRNTRTELEQALRNDTDAQRDLTVESAELAIERAQVTRQSKVDTQKERRIVAPFSGTVEGMENAVVGATPSRESNDSVDFGSLISDEFLVTFSLSANDVDRVQVGDRVLVSLSSVPGSAPLSAVVTEISSLPDGSTVAKYPVSAQIVDVASSSVRLRDGMLADVEIVREERSNVLRVPVAALSYAEGGRAQVTVVTGLTEAQTQQFARMGVVRTDTHVPNQTVRTVSVGLRGTYFAEITDGLMDGDLVLVSAKQNEVESSSTVVRTGFGAGGGRPPSGRENGESGDD